METGVTFNDMTASGTVERIHDVATGGSKLDALVDAAKPNGKDASAEQPQAQTQPAAAAQQMLMYRAASWFIRAYAPEIAMGLRTVEENIDMGPEEINVTKSGQQETRCPDCGLDFPGWIRCPCHFCPNKEAQAEAGPKKDKP